jgi:hypothetical protein
MFLPAARRSQLAGNFATGGCITFEKARCFDLDGSLAESKASVITSAHTTNT